MRKNSRQSAIPPDSYREAIGSSRLSIAFFLLVFLSLRGNLAFAQDVQVKGGFLSDSLKIGEQTTFYLSARYPSKLTILFPDSTYKFEPFEYQKKKYFATETKDTISFDSAVYYLTTFEVNRIQQLQLPVYAVHPQDCTEYRSEIDSILITQLVAKVPDSLKAEQLPLKMNTAYQNVHFQFNFFIVLIIIVVLVIIIVLVWILFGKKIARYFRTRKLQKMHTEFTQSYTDTINKLRSSFSTITAESAIALWKKYMEQLESRPYTKLTTRETLLMEKDEMLAKNLHYIDMAIYGHDTEVVHPFEQLKNFADNRFQKKLKEVQHGK